MVIEVAGGCSKGRFRPAVFVEAGPAKTFVSMLIIFGEIEIMFNQGSANKSVIADPIAAHPEVEKRKREKEQKEQQPLRFARVRPWWGRQTWLFHETSTYSKIDSLSGSFPHR